MRTRIMTTTWQGKSSLVKFYSKWGISGAAVLVTSETPAHAQSNIRKKSAFVRKQQLERQIDKTI